MEEQSDDVYPRKHTHSAVPEAPELQTPLLLQTVVPLLFEPGQRAEQSVSIYRRLCRRRSRKRPETQYAGAVSR